jgi:hypothetical protein
MEKKNRGSLLQDFFLWVCGMGSYRQWLLQVCCAVKTGTSSFVSLFRLESWLFPPSCLSFHSIQSLCASLSPFLNWRCRHCLSGSIVMGIKHKVLRRWSREFSDLLQDIQYQSLGLNPHLWTPWPTSSVLFTFTWIYVNESHTK